MSFKDRIVNMITGHLHLVTLGINLVMIFGIGVVLVVIDTQQASATITGETQFINSALGGICSLAISSPIPVGSPTPLLVNLLLNSMT